MAIAFEVDKRKQQKEKVPTNSPIVTDSKHFLHYFLIAKHTYTISPETQKLINPTLSGPKN